MKDSLIKLSCTCTFFAQMKEVAMGWKRGLNSTRSFQRRAWGFWSNEPSWAARETEVGWSCVNPTLRGACAGRLRFRRRYFDPLLPSRRACQARSDDNKWRRRRRWRDERPTLARTTRNRHAKVVNENQGEVVRRMENMRLHSQNVYLMKEAKEKPHLFSEGLYFKKVT